MIDVSPADMICLRAGMLQVFKSRRLRATLCKQDLSGLDMLDSIDDLKKDQIHTQFNANTRTSRYMSYDDMQGAWCPEALVSAKVLYHLKSYPERRIGGSLMVRSQSSRRTCGPWI